MIPSRVLRVAKWGATAALIALACRRIDPSELVSSLATLSLASLIVLALLTYLQVLLCACRWRRVLSRLGEDIPLRVLLEGSLVGTTYNMLLPTTVGGDVIRALRCASVLEVPSRAWASVVYERILGLLCLALLPLLGSLFVAHVPRTLLLVAAGCLVTFVGALLFAHAPLHLIGKLASRRAPRVAGTTRAVAEAFAGPLARVAARAETLGWSLLYQIVALSMLIVAGWQWGEPGLWAASFVGVPLILIAAMVPITIAGLGLRESLFVGILPSFGVAPAHAGVLALVWLASNCACALTGLLVLLVRRAERGTTEPSPR